MHNDRVIIVGGGVIGVACAYYLAKAGARPVLLEAKRLAAGASAGNAGLISPGHPPIPQPGVLREGLRMLCSPTSPLRIAPRKLFDPSFLRWMRAFRAACSQQAFLEAMKATAALSWETLKRFDELFSQESFRCDARQGGYLEASVTEAGLQTLLDDAELLRRFGFDARPVSVEEALRLEPALREDIAGAVWLREGRSCEPLSFTRQLAEAAAQRGAEIRHDAPVAGFEVHRRRLTAVALASGERIPARQAVLAAGVWATPLAKTLGLRLPLQPARGYHVDLEGPAEQALPRRAVLLAEAKTVATPMHNRLRLAGTLEFCTLGDPEQQQRFDLLLKRAVRYLKGHPPREVHRWSGYRPVLPDGLPVIGPAPQVHGALLAVGHAMLGLTFAPATGALIAQLAAGEEPAVDLAPFRADRF